MFKKTNFVLILAGLITAIVVFFKFFPNGTQILWQISNQGTWLLPLILVSALIDSINPCAFSILFLTVAFLFSLGKSKGEIFKIGTAYIIGIFIAYIAIGLGLLQALHFFNVPNFMGRVGAGILIVWGGLNLINHFFPKFPIKLKIPSFSHYKLAQLMHKATLPAAFLLGMLVGICEFPCTGGPYLMVIGLLHDKATYVTGLIYLFIYNVVFISPLIVILGLATSPGLHDRVATWRKTNTSKFQLIGAIVMLLIGFFILLM